MVKVALNLPTTKWKRVRPPTLGCRLFKGHERIRPKQRFRHKSPFMEIWDKEGRPQIIGKTVLEKNKIFMKLKTIFLHYTLTGSKTWGLLKNKHLVFLCPPLVVMNHKQNGPVACSCVLTFLMVISFTKKKIYKKLFTYNFVI